MVGVSSILVFSDVNVTKVYSSCGQVVQPSRLLPRVRVVGGQVQLLLRELHHVVRTPPQDDFSSTCVPLRKSWCAVGVGENLVGIQAEEQLYISLSLCLCLPVYLSIYPSIYLSIYIFIHICHVCKCISTRICANVYVYISASPLSPLPSVSLFSFLLLLGAWGGSSPPVPRGCPSLSLSLFLSLTVFVFLSLPRKGHAGLFKE